MIVKATSALNYILRIVVVAATVVAIVLLSFHCYDPNFGMCGGW